MRHHFQNGLFQAALIKQWLSLRAVKSHEKWFYGTEREGRETTSIHKEPTIADHVPGSSEVTGLSQKVCLKDFVIFLTAVMEVKLAYNKQNIFSVLHRDDFFVCIYLILFFINYSP